MNRFWCFADVPDDQWRNWHWQLQNRLGPTSDPQRFFPAFRDEDVAAFRRYTQRYRFALTPYTLSLIETDAEHQPLQQDPIWNQFRFLDESEHAGVHDYDGTRENWEVPGEMPTPILHHKYPNRAIFRLLNTCHGHCTYCYLTARVLDRDKESEHGHRALDWNRSLDYLRANPAITDVLLSGGDPLVLDNDRLDALLSDLATIPSITSIRLNTRACTFNPFRFDEGLAQVFKWHRLTALEVHLVHPREITPELDQALATFDRVGYRPLILWRAPLLHGINDSEEVLVDLLMKLYQRRITPYYLFHHAPYTLGRSRHGLPVKRGAQLLQRIRRLVPGPAFPRYTLFHIQGKQDIPLEPEGTPNFHYQTDEAGRPVVRFLNWRGNWVTYPDVDDHG